MNLASPTLFLAVASHHFDSAEAEIFTPCYMKWSKDLWILDLSSCYDYWTSQASNKNLQHLFKKMLGALHGQEEDYYAALAFTPWQAVIMVSVLQSKNLAGLVDDSDKIGRTLYQQLSWNTWWRALQEIAHYQPFNQAGFMQHQRLMQRAIARLGIQKPWDLQQATAASLQRRFGEKMSQVWQWTFAASQKQIQSFPWKPFVQSVMVCHEKHLEFPTIDWAVIRSHLQNSFHHLCQEPNWDLGDKILQLQWSLTLYDLSVFHLTIQFQHPHDLRRESPNFSTAIEQAFYSFDNHKNHSLSSKKGEWFEPSSPITSWVLAIQQKISLPPKLIDLFGDTSASGSLMALENRLPLKLKHFDYKDDWLPEDSYQTSCADRKMPGHHFLHYSLRALARQRPLFIYKNPQAFKNRPLSIQKWRLTEKTMDKWWLKSKKLERTYYKITTHKQCLWVYEDGLGNWFAQGVFA